MNFTHECLRDMKQWPNCTAFWGSRVDLLIPVTKFWCVSYIISFFDTDKQMVCYNNQSKTSHYATFSFHFSEIPKVTISFYNNLYSWNHSKEITLNNCPKPGTAIEVLLKLGILLSFLDFWLAALPSEAKQSKALVLLGYPSEFSSIEINAFILQSSSRF